MAEDRAASTPDEATSPPAAPATTGIKKSPAAFRTISEVSSELGVPQHVLRFWETKFTQVRPLKRGGGRRYYRPEDLALLRRIKGLLYEDGYTIRGVQKLLKDGGVRALVEGNGSAPAAAPAAAASGLDDDSRNRLRLILAELDSLSVLLKREP